MKDKNFNESYRLIDSRCNAKYANKSLTYNYFILLYELLLIIFYETGFPAKTFKTIAHPMLPDLDSNQDKQNQNLRYYRYTIGHYIANVRCNKALKK